MGKDEPTREPFEDAAWNLLFGGKSPDDLSDLSLMAPFLTDAQVVLLGKEIGHAITEWLDANRAKVTSLTDAVAAYQTDKDAEKFEAQLRLLDDTD